MFSTRTRTGSYFLSFKRPLRGKKATVPKNKTKAPVPANNRKQNRLVRARAQARRDCVAIINKCAVFGRLDMAAVFIGNGLSPGRVQRRLMAERNKCLRKSQKDSRISNHLATVSESQKGKLAANMKCRLEEMGLING